MIQELQHYTAALHFREISETTYTPTQLGTHIEQIVPGTDLGKLDIILVGCGEYRGQHRNSLYSDGPDKIREELYKLHYWHPEVKIGDLGNVMEGKSLADTRAALKTVLAELKTLGKKVIVLGGSHDLTLQQYEVFKDAEELINLLKEEYHLK